MWNSPAAPNPGTPQNSIWSPEQLVRLEYEWGRLQRSYAYHPVVRVQPMQGDPPSEYQIEYRVRTLIIDEAGQLTYADTCKVHVRLGPDFPHGAPTVSPMSAVFHPNAAADVLQIIPAWQPTSTMVDLVQRLGALLAFQSYDPYNVWNPVAMQWVSENAGYVPTDPEADLSPDAGGDPLDRICRHGEQTIREIEKTLQQRCAMMLDAKSPPPVAELQSFSHRTRMALGPFTAPDIPVSLNSPANQLDQWAGDLPHSAPHFEALRKLKANTVHALAGAADLDDAQKSVASELTTLDEMLTAPLADDPRQVLEQLPSLADLQGIHAQLRTQQTKAAQRLITARQRLDAVQMPARPDKSFFFALQNILELEITRQTASVVNARERLTGVIGIATPILDRTRLELDALEKLLGWREYADMRAKANDLVEQVQQWGSAGVQAYFVANESGEYGPFEFEQNLDLGAAPLIVRNTGRTGLEAVDVKSGLRLGRSESGEVRAAVPGEAPGESYPTTFRMTARCDDLAVQFDYLLRQTRALLSRLAGMAPAAPSWGGKVLAAFAAPPAWGALKTDYEALAATIAALAGDLVALAPYKERLATYFLLDRLNEAIPRWQQEHAEALALLDRHAARVGEILARSGKDLENNRPIIPAKLEKDYKESSEKHEQAHRELVRLEKLQQISANQIKARTESRTMFGKAQPPAPRMLQPLPAELTEIGNALSDAAITATVNALGGLLNVEFSLPHTRKHQPDAVPTPTAPARPPAPGASAAAPPPAPPGSAAAPPAAPPSVAAVAGVAPAAPPAVPTKPASAQPPAPPALAAPADAPAADVIEVVELEEVLPEDDSGHPVAYPAAGEDVEMPVESEFPETVDPEGEIAGAELEFPQPAEGGQEEGYAAEAADGFFIHDEPQEAAGEETAEASDDLYGDWPTPPAPTPPK